MAAEVHFSRQTGREQESDRAQCPFFYNMAVARFGIHTVQYECVLKEGERHYFHFYSRAAQHPPQSARWPKPCTNPRSCSLMCPRKHACTHTHRATRHTLLRNRLWCHQCWTYISPCTHTCMRLYSVHRDIRINRFVKLGLSSHIHRNHGIRCINALPSWICIRQWCATRTEDYFWQTLLLSPALFLSCALQHTQEGSQLITPTHWHTYRGLYSPQHTRSWSGRGYGIPQTATACKAIFHQLFFFALSSVLFLGNANLIV